MIKLNTENICLSESDKKLNVILLSDSLVIGYRWYYFYFDAIDYPKVYTVIESPLLCTTFLYTNQHRVNQILRFVHYCITVIQFFIVLVQKNIFYNYNFVKNLYNLYCTILLFM